ncbi:MAG TPA: aspartate aminotransferase family protein [Solirubrobacterales bacterium]|nr:aspartate aminotransferase family protein [Solirubrobacterales bacterium]
MPASKHVASDLEHLIHPLTDHSVLTQAGPLVIAEGDDCELVSEDGRRLIDGMAGLWTVNVGHGRQELIEAAVEQLRSLAYVSTFGGVSSPPPIQLAEKIAALAPPGLNGVFFVSGGSEANETAIKLARRHWVRRGRPEKSIVLAHERGYHGLAGVTTTTTRLQPYHGDFGVGAPDVHEVPTPYVYRCPAGTPCDPASCAVCTGASLEGRIAELGAERIAAVIVEPVFGSGGVIVPPPGYLRRLREICDRHRLLLIVDEVITGFGRTGTWFACEHEAVVPDLITFAKGVTSGYVPLGGVIVSDALWDELREPGGRPGVLMHGFTHSGHPVACAVALANIETIEREDLLARVRESSESLARLVAPLREHPEVGEVRQAGLMVGVELVADRATRQRWPAEAARGRRVATEARERGLLTRCLLDDVLCLAPPFTISEETLGRAVEILAESLESTRDPHRRSGSG